MSKSGVPSKSFKIVHWGAFAFLLLMMLQPTFDNVRALLTGVLIMGGESVSVGLSDMLLHYLGMTLGWVGLWWFFKRQRRGAYVSVAAHLCGLTGALTQQPDLLLAMMPAWAIAVFFVVLIVIALGPVLAFKDEYS